ncbi:MAG: DUF2200 family protein, partial [Anaerolineales bacterium]|nr:DUF2200 family protein [Anaerolineales bacterium]
MSGRARSPPAASDSAGAQGRIRSSKEAAMTKNRVFAMKFAEVYPLYVKKAERKNRTQAEVDQIIRWLTGYTQAGLQKQIK